jgi:hypothetical protein
VAKRKGKKRVVMPSGLGVIKEVEDEDEDNENNEPGKGAGVNKIAKLELNKLKEKAKKESIEKIDTDFLPRPSNLVQFYLFVFPISFVMLGNKVLWYELKYLNEAIVLDVPNLMIPIAINIIFLFMIQTQKGMDKKVRRAQILRHMALLGLMVIFAFKPPLIMYYVIVWMSAEMIVSIIELYKRIAYLLVKYRSLHTWLSKKKDGSKKFHSKNKAKDLMAKQIEEEARLKELEEQEKKR